MTASIRREFLDLIAAMRPGHPDWDLAVLGGDLTDWATRGVAPEDVLLQTALALKHSEGVWEVRAALAPRPGQQPRTRKDQQ